MGRPWALPFLGILLSIATGPLFFARVWHHYFGKIAFGWSILALLPIAFASNAHAEFLKQTTIGCKKIETTAHVLSITLQNEAATELAIEKYLVTGECARVNSGQISVVVKRTPYLCIKNTEVSNCLWVHETQIGD